MSLFFLRCPLRPSMRSSELGVRHLSRLTSPHAVCCVVAFGDRVCPSVEARPTCPKSLDAKPTAWERCLFFGFWEPLAKRVDAVVARLCVE
jgi:hypothetical protein